jgi:hypothetical protein
MHKIRLETENGEFVTMAEMLPYPTWPAMVIWGQRAFQLVTVQKEGEPVTYREVFVVHPVRVFEVDE